LKKGIFVINYLVIMRHLYFFSVLLLICIRTGAQTVNNKIGDTIHAIHYSIHLNDINTNNQTIDAFTELEITPLVNDLISIPLELKSLTVDSVLVNNVQKTFTLQNEILRINLVNPVGQNDTLMIGVYYHGQPFHEAWGGFHFSGDYAFNLGVGFESIPHNLGKTWFPCIDDFTDRATYDVFATVDNDKKAIGGGTLIDTIDNGNGTKTWHWNLSHPIPTYLASIAVGDYMLYADSFYGIEDTVPIWIYVRPSDIDRVEGSFINLKAILHWYEEKFGPYPFSRVGYTGTAIGAMEHATNIAYPNFAVNGNTSYESLYTHELAHMWFGDEVTCSSAEDMWLNEGWATFCELFYLDDLYGHDDFINTMRHEQREMLRRTHKVDKGYYALNDIPQEYTYGSHAYDKGGSVANTLRGYLGDSTFFDAMTAFLTNYKYESVSSEDLRDFLTGYTGIDMTPFFDAWVMTPGTPHFSIDSTKVTEENASFKVDIWLKQKYKGAEFYANDNVLEIGFVDDAFIFHTDTIHFSGQTGHSVKYTEFEPRAVFLDPFEKIEDATTDNFEVFTEPEEYTFPETYFRIVIDELSDSALIRTTHNWVAPDSLKTPVDGLRLSPYRYWKVDGIFPEGMSAHGRFLYDYSNYLDDGLILSENDSVVLLYRTGSADDWHEIPQTRIGNWNVGYIITDELLKGEYTLAVWDKTITHIGEEPLDEFVKVFPNPTRGILNFKFARKGKYIIEIYDTMGSQVSRFYINGRSKSWKWNDNSAFTGVYLIRVYENHELLTIKKLVFSN
jgi:hypothetical protein